MRGPEALLLYLSEMIPLLFVGLESTIAERAGGSSVTSGLGCCSGAGGHCDGLGVAQYPAVIEHRATHGALSQMVLQKNRGQGRKGRQGPKTELPGTMNVL